MVNNLLEITASGLFPVHKSIGLYDTNRPLNDAARQSQGLTGAWNIATSEAAELVALRTQVDQIPPERLNGQRKMVKEELGDLAFGLAEVLRYLPIQAMSLDQKETVMQWCSLAHDTEQRYGLDLAAAGVWVNDQKNTDNNPVWAYRHHHPLDGIGIVTERNEMARRGLRAIRDMDPAGKLRTENMNLVMMTFGYTERVLRQKTCLGK